MTIYILTFLALFAVGCEQGTNSRSANRPANDLEEIPSYLAQRTESVPAGEPTTISLENTTLVITEDTTQEDAEVRLRILKSVPENLATVDLGQPKGDIVEIAFYRRETGDVFPSSFLNKPFEFQQHLDGVANQDDLKYVVTTSPGTDNEETKIIKREGIRTVLAIAAVSAIEATLELQVTFAIIYAIESDQTPAHVISISNTNSISNESSTTAISSFPNPPTDVVDGSSHNSTSQTPLISWTASTSENVSTYEVAIGSESGGNDVKNWTEVGNVESIQLDGLELQSGTLYYGSVRARNENDELSSISKGDGWLVDSELTSICDNLPGGLWVAVPKNPSVGQAEDFCIMKFEAKEVDDAAVSQPDGSPWVDLTRNEARAKCSALGSNQTGPQFTLTTNAMWQTIGRNIETARSGADYLNWSNGSIEGNNALNRGHSDFQPASILAVADMSDPCDGTGQTDCMDNTTTDFRQKRTHTLSNQEEIWDFAGNAWEWVFEQITTPPGTSGDYVSQNPMADVLQWGPEGNYSAKDSGEYGGLGHFMNGVGGIIRGGTYSNGALSGVFATGFTVAEGHSAPFIGFRCAAIP